MSVLVPSIYITLLQRFAEAGFFTYTENIDQQYIHAKSEVFYNQHFDLLLSLIDNQAQVADSLSVIQREGYELPSFLEVFNSHIDALAEDYVDLSFQYKRRNVFYLGDLHACSLNRNNNTSETCRVVKNLADLELPPPPLGGTLVIAFAGAFYVLWLGDYVERMQQPYVALVSTATEGFLSVEPPPHKLSLLAHAR